ncbi:hypothetical protein C4E04_08830 [Microvirga sp. 17 mud 1-3]|nr:hypothetical protein C4E04_08830 [Microvirga sp. 17 mud 1-3]
MPHRRGQYRLVRLAEKHGADIQLCDRLDKIALDCPMKSLLWERPRGQYDPKCKARHTDLEAISHPSPDLPPMMRKLIRWEGSKGISPPNTAP